MRREFFNRGGYQDNGDGFSERDEDGNYYDSYGNFIGYIDDSGMIWDDCNTYVGRMDEYGNMENECGEYIGYTDANNHSWNAANYRITAADEDGYTSGLKDSSVGSACFLTTACVTYKGLSDDCYELATLRKFRDTYMVNNMKSEVKKYYNMAPKIVKKINSLPEEDKKLWYSAIYDIVKKCCVMIESKDNKSAYILYKKMVFDLTTELMDNKQIS